VCAPSRTSTSEYAENTRDCCCLTQGSNRANQVSTLAWNGDLLSSGGREKTIYNHDIRAPSISYRLAGHKQEVCGLRWSPDGSQLASGGNDNKLFVWAAGASGAPTHRYGEHRAAVKALAWSPHQRGLLASGGGTADKCIKVRCSVGSKLTDISHEDMERAFVEHCVHQLPGHGLAGVQRDVCPHLQRTGQYTRLFSESSLCLVIHCVCIASRS
jgi:WD40 repeat protein